MAARGCRGADPDRLRTVGRHAARPRLRSRGWQLVTRRRSPEEALRPSRSPADVNRCGDDTAMTSPGDTALRLRTAHADHACARSRPELSRLCPATVRMRLHLGLRDELCLGL